MAKKCRHRKRVLLASANYVEFTPDQEPFTSGTIESSGIETIQLDAVNIHYCPKCNVVQDIEFDGHFTVFEI